MICSGLNPRQLQAICNEVADRIAEAENRQPISVEGFQDSEWVLMDYGDLVVHIFSESTRKFYDLERLWRTAKELDVPAALKAS